MDTLSGMQGSEMGLGYWPHAILGAYLFILLGLGWLSYRRGATGEEDYYLAGRNQGWLVSSLTIMATFFSSAALLGAPAMVYKEGVVFALFALNVPFSGAVVYVIGRRIQQMGRARGCVTPADLICDVYGSRVALRLLTALIGFLYAVPYVVMQIQAGGILSQQLFPGPHSFEIGASVLACVTMIYIMIGGMRSVAWSDVLQGFLLISGMLVAGWATVAALGGITSFLERLRSLPNTSLSVPGTTGSWTPEKLWSVCVFAALGSMIQPAQWMRYYSASSVRTLRRSAVIFAVVLTGCFLFGIMLVGLGGQVLYPIQAEQGLTMPHPDVGATARDFDQITVVILKNHLPELLGTLGPPVGVLILVAIMAAAMSTADSNLHALSAVFTRDIFDRFIAPNSSDRTRTWVGRAVIAAATVLALCLLFISRSSATFDPIGMIVQLQFLAIGFATQLLPVTIDMLFVRRGSRVGAIAGMAAGIGVVLLFSPLVPIFTGENSDASNLFLDAKKVLDIGTWGLMANVTMFVLVSWFDHRRAASAGG